MTSSVDLQELAIVIAAKKHNPALLNPDFLKCSGIISEDWNLAQQPVLTPQMAQLSFQNGVSLVAQTDRILFIEPIAAKSLQDVLIAEVAQTYIQALPNADYQAAGINLRGIALSSRQEATAQSLMHKFLAAGSWQTFGKAPIQANLNFTYTLERGKLFLSVNEIFLQKEEEPLLPALLFAGNFEYDFSTVESDERLSKLSNAITQWQADLEIYRDLINHRFLDSDRPTWDLGVPTPVGIGT